MTGGRLALRVGGALLATLVVMAPRLAGAAEGESGAHEDPFSSVLLTAAVVLIIALVGRGLAQRARQPAVLGELLIGVVVGNVGYWLAIPTFIVIMNFSEASALLSEVWASGLSVGAVAEQEFPRQNLAPGEPVSELVEVLTGPDALGLVRTGLTLWMFSNLGVLLLLFMAGLESSVEEMTETGGSAVLVALLGVVAPVVLSLATTYFVLPGVAFATHLFIATTLAATSVGITARVFRDLGRMATREAKLILGAAVIDDVLGLIVLAVVVGIVATGEIDLGEVARIVLISGAFLGAILIFGPWLAAKGVPLFRAFDRYRVKLLYPLCLMFLLAWLASLIGLASIVGAFAAGLILSEGHFRPEDNAQRLRSVQLLAPLEALFAPVFFVLIGMQVNLMTFLDLEVAALALVLSVAAILGKLLCGLGAGRAADRLTVGLGMVPRGEVGLIFAGVGRSLGVLGDAEFSAVVLMVIITTLIAPLALRWSLGRTLSKG
jgi:Kef-type K+ transport system membrane component KefB